MKKRKAIMMAAMAVGMFGWAAAAGAEILALNPAQDASVKWGYAGQNDSLGVINNHATQRWRFYIQFDLPTGTAGNITNATLDLVVRTAVHRQLDVALLTNESIDTWDEATMTYATAPGTVNADADQNYGAASYVLADTAQLIDNEEVPGGVGTTHTFDLSSSLALLNADTDNKLTFIFSGAQTSTDQPRFDLSEIAGNEPVLNLGVIPEPSTLSMIGIASLGLMVIRRKLAM